MTTVQLGSGDSATETRPTVHSGKATGHGMAVDLVLFDRDGTLVHDVPYNGGPERVRVVDGASAALLRLRSLGVKTGVVTNQSGVARGLLSPAQVDAVNARIEQMLGPFDVWQMCQHAPADQCPCRKPAPGMVLAAASTLGIAPSRVAVIGDIGADVQAAAAAGARGVLVPTSETLPAEVHAAAVVARSLGEAVDVVLSWDGTQAREHARSVTAEELR